MTAPIDRDLMQPAAQEYQRPHEADGADRRIDLSQTAQRGPRLGRRTLLQLIAATGTLTTTVSLQQWNASAEQWEALPAQVNHDAQTITAAINVPATLALWQPETETLPVESVEENGETEETAAPDQFSIYLPLVQK